MRKQPHWQCLLAAVFTTSAPVSAACMTRCRHSLPQGLRTLVVAGKSLEEDDWAAWDARYQQAAADLEHRDELVRWGCRRI